MTATDCDSLHAYVDGELSPEDRETFETHLTTCEACGAELPKLLALMSVLDNAMTATAPKLSVVSGGDGPPTVRPVPTKSKLKRRPLWLASGGVAAAAAVLVVLFWHGDKPSVPPPPSIASALGPTRTNEWRTSYPGTDAYRPRDVARGVASSESIPLETLASLERAKDYDGMAVASLLSGDRERAARAFAQAPNTPDVDSDRAALELADGSAEAVERALDDVDRALAADPNNPRALWNRALVLAKLELGFAAALDFERVAALKEPGWADEAASRAKVLRETVEKRQERWEKANAAGQALVKDGTPVPSDVLANGGAPLLLYSLYDAVRSAPSRERAEGLVPLAQAIDSAYGTDRMTGYVQRIAKSDWHIRKPLADRYRELVEHKGALPAAEADAFIKQLEAAKADDIWLGAVGWLGRISSRLDDYRKRAEATRDPWFAAIVEQEAAKTEIARGANIAAERRLREAIAVAKRERVAYRVLTLEDTLASLHDGTRHLSQAADDRQLQYRDSMAAGEWRREMNALGQLSAVNLDRYAESLARVYLIEILERLKTNGVPEDCQWRQYAYEELASVSLALDDADKARNELASVPVCTERQFTDAKPTSALWRAALVRGQLYRAGHRAEDARLARAGVASVRSASDLAPTDRARIAYIEGALLDDLDSDTSQRTLHEAITALGHDTSAEATKWRAGLYNALALLAGRQSRFDDVIGALAATLEVSKPTQCALAIAIAIEHEPSVVAYLDAQGKSGGQIIANKNPLHLDVSTLIPATIVDHLRRCKQTTVLARAPVLGAGHLLDPAIAWSYSLPRASSLGRSVTTPRRVVIDSPEIPADLKLPTLDPSPERASTNVDVLRGSDATPSRVLQAIRTASVVEFHTHGIIGNDLSEASYLVLSPELDRRYALTPTDVMQARLEANPLVILGACHAATSSRSLEGGLGLAEAFLRSGARAVIASPDSVQDLGARAFFAAVRDAIMRGIDPAIALRDERIRSLAVSPSNNWVTGVVVFE